MFKIGLVGTGPWGMTLAQVFKKSGAEVVCHDHVQKYRASDVGVRLEWPRMIDLGNLDAIAVAAPPRITSAVVKTCAVRGMPVLASKPVMLDDEYQLTSPLYVDYIHLWSPCYRAMREAVKTKIRKISVEFYGHGPVRSFSPLLDYGPHALSFIFDLLGPSDINSDILASTMQIAKHTILKPTGDGELHVVEGWVKGIPVSFAVGNGGMDTKRRLQVITENNDEAVYEEFKPGVEFSFNGRGMKLPSHDPLGTLVHKFMEDVGRKKIDAHSMRLCVAMTKVFRELLGDDSF